MADVYARVRDLERKLHFIMTSMRMKAAVTNGLLGADGRPQANIFEGNLLELYHLSRQIPTVGEDQAEPPVEIPKEPDLTVKTVDEPVEPASETQNG